MVAYSDTRLTIFKNTSAWYVKHQKSDMSHRFFLPPVGLSRRGRRCPEPEEYQPMVVGYTATHGPIYFPDLSIRSRKNSLLFGSRGFIDTRVPGRVPKPVFLDSEGPRVLSRSFEPHREAGKVSFTRAMRKLYRESAKAETFYQGFYDDFNSEIQPIKQYATQGIRVELWQLKSGRVATDRRNSASTEVDDRSDQEGSPEQFSEKFDAWEDKVNRAMQAAIDATLGESSSATRKTNNRLDSRKRLQKKVEVCSEQIADLLQKAPEDHDDCKALLSELGALKTLIDPDDEKNLEVYKDSEDGEAEDEGDD